MGENVQVAIVVGMLAALPAFIAAITAYLDRRETKRLRGDVAKLQVSGNGHAVSSRLERENCSHHFAEVRRVLQRLEDRLDSKDSCRNDGK